MEATPNAAAVTPQGVRDGDPGVLRALIARRGPAVLAFCAEILGPVEAPRAAAEALARFRAAVYATPDLSTLDPDALLRGAARHSAAAMVESPPPSGRLRRRDAQCAHVPTLLAARASGALGDADRERLYRHLQRCERCRALEESFRRAETAYGEAPDEPLPHRTTALLLAALEAAAPVAGDEQAAVAEPVPAAPEPEPAAEEPEPALEEPEPALEAPEPALEEPEPALEEPEEPQPLAAGPALVAVPPEPPPTEPLRVEDIAAATPAPPVDEPVAGHPADGQLGETVAFDALPAVPAEHHGPLGGRLLGGGRERRGGVSRGARIGVPVLIVAAGIAGALAIAGVFDGGDSGSSKGGGTPTETTVTR